MKKLIGILLTVVLCFAVMVNTLADDNTYKITINGVNVVLTDGKAVLEPIENDGIVYVPLEALLKAMNIEYEVDGKDFTISTTVAEEKPTPTPKPTSTPKPASAYSKLSSKEKKFLDILLKNIKLFNNPASIKILEVWETTGSLTAYYVDVDEQGSYGIEKVRYYIDSIGGERKYSFSFNVDVQNVSYNYQNLNAALTEKLTALGYIKK